MTRVFSSLGVLIIVLISGSLRSETPHSRLNSQQAAIASKPEAPQETLAPTPPMGWNSWDSFGTTVTEADVKANAEWLARNLKPYGWVYVVVDMEWFVTNPISEGNSKSSQYRMDEYGRYLPDQARFPPAPNGAGFKALAEYVHSLGLKFGIHILRGIPKQAVEKNLPIAGSPYRAADAADQSDTCPWNYDNYGTDPSKPAAQAYYDSIARLYASWGVDFVKADCIASRPYKGDDIRMLSTALRKTGRPIVLSLSPGEAPIGKVDELTEYSEMWRISDDVWDLWHSTVAYPQGLNDQFARAANWVARASPGHWPDADMVPLGYLGPSPGWGKQARNSRLTHDEQRTLFTLWCMFRSPLMIGANLPKSDSWTTTLLTNPEVLAVDQQTKENHAVITNSDAVVWVARAKDKRQFYVAVFNRGESLQSAHYLWKDLGIPETRYKVRDLWRRQDLGDFPSLTVRLSPHSSVLYRIEPLS
jgi:alpha-galactosidase